LFESFTEDHEQEDQEQENREQDQEQEDQEQENQEQLHEQEDQEQENQEQDHEQEDQEQEDEEQEDQEQEDQEQEDQEQEGQELEDQEQEDQEQHGGLVVNCSQRVTSPQDSKVQTVPVFLKESAVLDGDKEALLDEVDTIVDENAVSHVSAPVASPVDPYHLGELSTNLTVNSDRKYLAAGDMKEMVLVKENIPYGPRSPQSVPEITEGGDRGSSPILR
jgi:DNA mismatch repair ATPase MutL